MTKLLYLGNKLSKHGLTKGVIETLGPQLEELGYEVSYAGESAGTFSRLLEMCSKVIRQSRKVDYVLIDTYSTSAFWYAWISGMLCRILRIKFVCILHGGNLPRRIQSNKWISNQIFKFSFANVAVSRYLNHHFSEAGYRSIIIPNNIEILLYKHKVREEFVPKLLWVRSFHRQYNPNMAADTLKLLLDKYPNSELCMVGPDKDGSLQEFQDYCSALGISQYVKVTGLLSKSDWHILSEEYDFFINTTNVDNTPVSVIEAMALGLPVISTDVDGMPFLIKNGVTGKLVKPNDSKQMCFEIEKLILNREDAKSIARAGRKQVELYDWNLIKNSWLKLLTH
jgi:glycosyltransferase involved in cell wall biosynthesis